MKSPAGEHPYLPPSLRYFVPLGTDIGSPGEYACFEYDIVEAQRPEMIVDLGSGNASSFAVFCQSIKDHDIDGLAYGIDIWESDRTRDAEGATTLTAINNFVHTHFRGHAYLLKLTPEQALAHFADETVDLLRIDLGRTERPFPAVLDAWAPKLKPGAVLLLAGVAGRSRVLEAIAHRSPVVFPDGGGLAAMVHTGPESGGRRSALLQAIADSDGAGKRGLVAFYEHAALHHALRHEILGNADVLYRKRPDK